MTNYYSVTIWHPSDIEFDPWTSVFSTREKATEFLIKVEDEITARDLEFEVCLDSGEIDGEEYLSWFRGEE